MSHAYTAAVMHGAPWGKGLSHARLRTMGDAPIGAGGHDPALLEAKGTAGT